MRPAEGWEFQQARQNISFRSRHHGVCVGGESRSLLKFPLSSVSVSTVVHTAIRQANTQHLEDTSDLRMASMCVVCTWYTSRQWLCFFAVRAWMGFYRRKRIYPWKTFWAARACVLCVLGKKVIYRLLFVCRTGGRGNNTQQIFKGLSSLLTARCLMAENIVRTSIIVRRICLFGNDGYKQVYRHLLVTQEHFECGYVLYIHGFLVYLCMYAGYNGVWPEKTLSIYLRHLPWPRVE